MTNEQWIETVIQRCEDAMRSVGAPNFEEGMRQAIAVWGFVYSGVSSMRTKDDLRAALQQMPKPSLLEKRMLLGVVRFLPQILVFGLKCLVDKAAADFPMPPHGRPKTDLSVA